MEWMDGLSYEEWEEKHPALTEYVHGKCDEWVLENFRPGDTAVIWNEFNPHLNRVCIIHCYLERAGGYVDVRGFTEYLDEIRDEFDWYPDNACYKCSNLNEFKKVICEICGYEDEKWR